MKHCFLKCKTFGQDVSDSAVIDFAFVVVDSDRFLSDTPYTTESLKEVKNFKLSVKNQVDNYGFVVYKDTLAFWESKPKNIRESILPQKSDMRLPAFTDSVISFLTENGTIDYWWARSTVFDPFILSRLFDVLGKKSSLEAVLPHWKLRDVRTFIDSKLDFPKKNMFVPIQDVDIWNKFDVECDSDISVMADVLRMQAIFRAENDLEMIDK